ncbi:hypothetical protein BT96DRAFT_648708 [Gymnopus androsaceus JB14]|uniref:Uncharacterized protein n=1 Tax=Gymnopus androsaceus JB14 TaxID=1447944 RepID=A0A6A4HSQ4_9AGAR|nr:hypothetical protein BT96DRAFT_648708 [Gymnopus androsaceus JB14]
MINQEPRRSLHNEQIQHYHYHSLVGNWVIFEEEPGSQAAELAAAPTGQVVPWRSTPSPAAASSGPSRITVPPKMASTRVELLPMGRTSGAHVHMTTVEGSADH